MMTATRAALALLAAFGVAGLTFASAETPSPAGAKVYFINLKNGQDVTSPFLVQFGLSGMGVAPAGVEKANTGHHRLLIDTALSGDALKQPIPMEDTHRHFGNGQTEAMITLPPGKHTLQLVLGDWSPRSARAAGHVGRHYHHGALTTAVSRRRALLCPLPIPWMC
jgi:Domain of unknown function (DUF4399)